MATGAGKIKSRFHWAFAWQEQFDSPAFRRMIWLILGGFSFLLFAYRAWVIPETDFVAYYNAGHRALTGETLYQNELTPFKYLPFVSYFFIPFTVFPFPWAKFLFFVVNFIFGLSVYRWVSMRFGNLSAGILFVSFIRFHNYDFLNSQVNHFLLGLYFYYLYQREKHPMRSAFAFSALASFKVVPLILLAPTFFRRRFAEVARIIGVFLILSALPVMTFKSGIRIYLEWYQLMKATTPFPAPDGPIFQSLQAALWFWIGSWMPADYFSGVVLLIVSMMFALCCFVAFRSEKIEQERAVLCATLVLSVIASPLAWKHNYLLLFPGVLFMIEAGKFGLVWLQLFLMTLGPALVALYSKHWADRSYITLMGAIVIFFGLLEIAAPRRELHHGQVRTH